MSCNNGLIDTRTKHTVAQDRWAVAEQRTLDVERQKSSSQLQLLAFEQKQAERKLSSLQNLEQSLVHQRYRSISEANLQNNHQLIESLDISFSKLHAFLSHSNQDLLPLPARVEGLQRSFSSASDRSVPENLFSNSNPASSDDDNNSKSIRRQPIPLPQVAVIPPEEEHQYEMY